MSTPATGCRVSRAFTAVRSTTPVRCTAESSGKSRTEEQDAGHHHRHEGEHEGDADGAPAQVAPRRGVVDDGGGALQACEEAAADPEQPEQGEVGKHPGRQGADGASPAPPASGSRSAKVLPSSGAVATSRRLPPSWVASSRLM